MSHSDKDASIPLSLKIRERIQKAGKQFFSNDNISQFLEAGEQEALAKEVESACEQLLRSLVIDTENDPNCKDTARRMARMYVMEIFAGRYTVRPTVTEFPNSAQLDELMIVGPIKVRSACSHHFCPIIGDIWIGIMPKHNGNVIGLSKFVRIIDWILARPHIQEEAIMMVADMIEELTQAKGVAIVMQATHFCMSWRGVKQPGGLMINSVMRGTFRNNPAQRTEFLALIPKKAG